MLLPGKDGFVVPENYFEELAERILAVVSLKSTAAANPFTLPEDYFETLANEITSVANLAALKNPGTFEIPENYFAQLDETLKTNIALDNLKQDEGFKVPENYFGKLGDSVLSRIAVEELNTGSDADVPEGYFDTLADRLANRIAEEENNVKEKNNERGRIIVFAEILKRYARPASIAASLALVIGVSSWFFNRSENNPGQTIAAKDVHSKQQILPIVPLSKKDSALLPLQQLVNNTTIDSAKTAVKYKSPRKINPPPQVVVKDENKHVDKNDVMEQVDLLDAGTIADFVNAQGTELKNQSDELLNESMKEYLLNDNADPGLIINNEQEHQ
jgi:hypothetical protein